MTTSNNWTQVSECTLPTVERPSRLAEFADLFRSVTQVRRIDNTSARISLVGRAGLVARAADLVDRETACCSFFGFILTPYRPSASQADETWEGVHLDVAVPARYQHVLAALLDQASTGLASRGAS
ncbi:MAG: hypothetical protein ACRCYU_07660 [Nocardioides sp.]